MPLDGQTVWLVIAAALLSGLLSTLIAIYFEFRRRTRQPKVDLLRSIIRLKSDLTSKESLGALNEVPITFYGHDEVEKAWTSLSRNAEKAGQLDLQEFIDLLRAMMKAVGRKSENISDADLIRTFKVADTQMKK